MRSARAMTLVEVLAALALLVVLSGGVLAFFFGVTQRRDELARLASQQRDAAAVLDRLESALMTSIALAPDGSAGVRGDARSITIATRGVGTPFEGAAAATDAAWLALEFDEKGARCDCTLTPLSGGGALREPMLVEVERMRFRYLRGRDWSESFDSLEAGGLPSAIEVSIWLGARSGAGEEEPVREPEAPGQAGDEAEEPDMLILEPPGMEPTPEAVPWTPREPDHTRIIVIPDAPEAGWQGGSP